MVTLDRVLGMVDRIAETSLAVVIARNIVSDNQLALIPPPTRTPTMPGDRLAEEPSPFDARPPAPATRTLVGLRDPSAAIAPRAAPPHAADAAPPAAAAPPPGSTAAADAAGRAGTAAARGPGAGEAPAGTALSAALATAPGAAARDAVAAERTAAMRGSSEAGPAAPNPARARPAATAGDASTAEMRALTARELLDRAIDEALALMADEPAGAERTGTAAALDDRRGREAALDRRDTAERAVTERTAADRTLAAQRAAAPGTAAAAERSTAAGAAETAGRTGTAATALPGTAAPGSAALASPGLGPAALGLPDPAALAAALSGGTAGTIIDSMILNAAMIPGWPRPRAPVGIEPQEERARVRPGADGAVKEPSLVGEALLLAYLAALGVGEAMLARIRALLADDERRRGFLMTLARLLKAIKLVMATLRDELERMRAEAEEPPPPPGTDPGLDGRLRLHLK